MTTYSFENEKTTIRKREDAEMELKIFLKRLGFLDSLPMNYPIHKELLIQYVIDVHLNIFWYEKAKKKEQKRIKTYGVSSLALLLLIPFAIWYISNNSKAENLEAVMTQVTALITGLLAVHKAFSTWIDKRKFIGQFWKAAADLKENLYHLEEAWNKGKAVDEDNHFTEDFIRAIKNSLAKARKITTAERAQYFQTFSKPSISLLGTFLEAKNQHQKIFDSYQSTEVQEAILSHQNMHKQENDFETADKQVHQLKHLIEEWEQLIEDTKLKMKKSAHSDHADLQKYLAELAREKQQSVKEWVMAKARRAIYEEI